METVKLFMLEAMEKRKIKKHIWKTGYSLSIIQRRCQYVFLRNKVRLLVIGKIWDTTIKQMVTECVKSQLKKTKKLGKLLLLFQKNNSNLKEDSIKKYYKMCQRNSATSFLKWRKKVRKHCYDDLGFVQKFIKYRD